MSYSGNELHGQINARPSFPTPTTGTPTTVGMCGTVQSIIGGVLLFSNHVALCIYVWSHI